MRIVTYRHMLCCFIASMTISGDILANDLRQLKEQVWLSQDISKSDRLNAISKRPTECINPKAPKLITLGRLAFESPALLGGQAARIGLSCASCHPSGRTSPHFFLESISSSPGTADVTHSFFSSTGGNDTLTAVAIPDLAKLDQMKIQNRRSIGFRNKLRELIEVEFDGQRAPILMIDALQIYLGNIDTQYCKTTEQELHRHQLSDDWQRLQESVNALVNHSNKELNQLLIRISRKRLETIFLRYSNVKDSTINSNLVSLSRQLGALSLTNIHHKEQTKSLRHWHKQADKLFERLKEHEAISMYEPNILTQLIDLE